MSCQSMMTTDGMGGRMSKNLLSEKLIYGRIAYIDMDVELRRSFGKTQIGLGYRLLYSYLYLEINNEATEIDIIQHGLYISAGYVLDF